MPDATPDKAPPPGPEQWIDAYLNGELTADAGQHFERWLLEDPVHVEQLARAVLQDTHLRAAVVSRRLESGFSMLAGNNDENHDDERLQAVDQDVMNELVDQALTLRRQHEIEDAANAMLIADQKQDARERCFELRRSAEPEPTQRQIVIPKVVVWLGLAAALGLIAWIGWPKAETGTTLPTPPQTAQQGGSQAPPASPQPVYVARIDASVDTRWEGLDSGEVRLEQGKLLILRAGIARVTFGDGAAVLIEAPATFQPTGPNAMRLVEGRLSAQVPPSAHGFEVATPQMLVTDLGTEFGVHVTRRRGTLADVFDGLVTVTSPKSPSSAPLELNAGVAARASDDAPQIRTVEADPARFYRSIEAFAAAPALSGRGRLMRSAPRDLTYQAYESDVLTVVPERGRVAWSADWPVDETFGGGPNVGQPIDVYLVHYDAVGSEPSVTDGTEDREVVLTFDRPVLGVVTKSSSLYTTDPVLGSPGTAYPSPRDEFATGRGLEPEADSYELSADGKTLRIRMRTGPRADQMRVIVASPS